MMSMTDTLNCTVTKTLRGAAESKSALNAPFSTLTGLNEDNYSAG